MESGSKGELPKKTIMSPIHSSPKDFTANYIYEGLGDQKDMVPPSKELKF